MASNNLTPQQDLIVRDFYTEVLSNESLFPNDPVGRRQALALCRRLLGYVVIKGRHISEARYKEGLGLKLGEVPNLEDEWEADTRRAMDAINSSSEDEADSSVETESPAVRETVLSEDV